MSDHLERTLRAMKSFEKLVEDARTVRLQFQDADMDVPKPLALLLGETGRERGSVWRGPQPPKRPTRAKEHWLWADAKSLVPFELAPAILRREKRHIPASEIVGIILSEFLPNQNTTSILNTGPRLEAQGIIKRFDDGWHLLDASKAPYLYEGVAWGPAEVFQSQTVAAFRRMLILDLLKVMPGGLMTMQILEHLKTSGLVRGPVPTKELTMDDMEVLERENKVRRVGNAKKWVLNNDSKQ